MGGLHLRRILRRDGVAGGLCGRGAAVVPPIAEQRDRGVPATGSDAVLHGAQGRSSVSVSPGQLLVCA